MKVVPKGTKTDGVNSVFFWSIIVHPFSTPFVAYDYQKAIEKYKADKKQSMKEFEFADKWLYSDMRVQNRK